MLAMPAAVACADAGDLDDARQHLAAAERSAALWKGTAWQAAIAEARAHLDHAEGDRDAARRRLLEAAELRRCRPAARRRPMPRLNAVTAGRAVLALPGEPRERRDRRARWDAVGERRSSEGCRPAFRAHGVGEATRPARRPSFSLFATNVRFAHGSRTTPVPDGLRRSRRRPPLRRRGGRRYGGSRSRRGGTVRRNRARSPAATASKPARTASMSVAAAVVPAVAVVAVMICSAQTGRPVDGRHAS
jgi:hypothetical protein